MDGRGFFRVLAVIAVMVILAGIGIGIYNAGIGAGVAEAARQAAASGDPVAVLPGYGYGWHGYGGGFFPFGILFWILGFFLVFALVRAAFGGGRRWGGPGGGNGWREERERRLEDWHRAAHDERPPAG